jgi:hypothetical protein
MIIFVCDDVRSSTGGRGLNVAVMRWPGVLDAVLGRVAARFPRVEPR